MKNRHIGAFSIIPLAVVVTALLLAGASQAYDRYNDGCNTCHGRFVDGTSPQGTIFPSDNKHTMHRSNQYMNTQCDLCHSAGDENDPYIGRSDGTVDTPGLGCVGCHGRVQDGGHDGISNGLGAGLRQHHDRSGITGCLGCHVDSSPSNYTPVGENVLPAYFGSVDTDVHYPCNGVPASDINENWSNDTDYIGLDNNGDLAYDAADVTCVPEPSGPLLIASGVLLLGTISRRRVHQ